MVKFLISFLFSFKSFPENDTQFFSNPDRGGSEEQKCTRFRAHPDRKNICNIIYSIPGTKDSTERKITVACWSPMLKVYNKSEDHYFRTEWNGDKTWAAFSLKQSVDFIKSDTLKTIFGKSIEFHFNEEQRYMQRFKNEHWETYLCPNISKENRFGPVYLCTAKSKLITKQKSNMTIRSSKKKGTITSNKQQNIEHTSKTKLLPINNVGEPKICKTVAAVHLYKMTKAMTKSKQESMKTKSPSNCSLFLPVSDLLYDKLVWVLKSDRPMSKNIQDVFVFVTVYSFLDEETRAKFNPYSINVQSLQYLPVKELRAEGINRLFVEYELEPIIPTTRTKLQRLRRKPVNPFKDIKIFLTENFSPLSIMSSLQTKKLFVRVIGIKDYLTQTKFGKSLGVYGADMNDDRFSSCIKVPTTNEFQKVRTPVRTKSVLSRLNRGRSSVSRVGRYKSRKRDDQIIFQNKEFHFLIGMARIDLSPLVFGTSSVIAYEELSSLPVMIADSKTADIEHLSITVIHRDLCKYEKGSLQNRILYENNAMIKLTAKCGFLLTPQCVNADPSINHAFSRMITILLDKEFATEIVQKIIMHNRESLDMRDYRLPLVPFRKLYKVDPPSSFNSIFNFQNEPSCGTSEAGSEDHADTNFSEAYFSGFCIDCVNKILMYVEGPTISTFPSLLTELLKFNITQGRIIYSSDLIYETRIYDVFKQVGGIYCITMKSTVDDFLKKGSSLCHGFSVPESAWKALKTISKLLACKTVLEAVQDNYLPRPEQLISFDIEFGIPHCIVR